MTDHYLDSSVAAQILLGQSPEAARWFDGVSGSDDDTLVSSRLLRTELSRLLRREGLPVTLRDEVVDHVATIPVNDSILAEAEAIVPHVKTLDAIHLASLIRSGLDATVVTHDDRMRAVAELIGFRTFDPVRSAE